MECTYYANDTNLYTFWGRRYLSGIAATVFWRYLFTKPSGHHLVYSLLDVCRAGGGHFIQTSKKERSCSKMGVVFILQMLSFVALKRTWWSPATSPVSGDGSWWGFRDDGGESVIYAVTSAGNRTITTTAPWSRCAELSLIGLRR